MAGTFMRTFVVTGSVGRSTVQNNAGGKTQVKFKIFKFTLSQNHPRIIHSPERIRILFED